MSDLLTHWAIFEDLRRLSQVDPAVEPLFALIMQAEREFARLGALSRGGSRFVPHILQNLRQERDSICNDRVLRRKLAYALGGITHFPTDYVLKPLMSELAQADWNDTHHKMQGRALAASAYTDEASIPEISAYYDVYVFRQVYLSGQEEPFNRFLLASLPAGPAQALSDFIYSLFQRALLASHTLDPDFNNFDGWLDNLIAKVQPLYVGIDVYTRVFTNPDPVKMELYRVESDFYLASDPAIQAARALQRGEPLNAAELQVALTEGANRSGYARTLELGMNALRIASAYWNGASPEPPDLRQGFHWKPEK